MSLILYAHHTTGIDGYTDSAPGDTQVALFADSTSEATITEAALKWVLKTGSRVSGFTVKTYDTVTSAEIDVKAFTFQASGPNMALVPESVSIATRSSMTEDVTLWPQVSPLYADTSSGQNDGTNDHIFPGHLAEYIICYNDTLASPIKKGELVCWENSTYNEHHHIEPRDSDADAPIGVALDDIAAGGEYGRIAVDGYCDVLCTELVTTGDSIPWYTGSANKKYAYDDEGSYLIGHSVGDSIYDTSDHWVRLALSLSATTTTLAHSSTTGLDADDHTQYLLVDGTRAMTGNLDMGSNEIDEVTKITRSDGNLTIDLNSDSVERTLYVRNDGALGGTASLSVEDNLSVGDSITVGGTVDGVDILAHSTNADAHHAETHTIVSHDTTATGANLTTLTGGGETDLHYHKPLVAYPFGQRNTDSGSGYWDVPELVSGYAGYRAHTMPFDGSVRALSATYYVSTVTTTGNYELEVYVGVLKAAASVVVQNVTAITTATYYQVNDTYASGTYTFNAGDMIILYGRFASGLTGAWKDGVANLLVEFDLT